MILLIECVVFCLIMSTIVLVVLKKNPRIKLADYPSEIVAAVPRQTEEEKKEFKQLGGYSIIILSVLLMIAMYIEFRPIPLCHALIFLHLCVIFFSYALFDFFIIDLLIFRTIKPKFLVLEGTEDNPGYNTIKRHAQRLGTNCAYGILWAFILETFVSIIMVIF